MFKKRRFINLKSVLMSLLGVVFLFGGLFINTSNVYAAGEVRTVYTSYTLSPVISTPNSEGGVTTKVLVGCAVGSGDLYDINTGKPCASYTTTKVLVGCAVGSGDLYDINTGKPCVNTKPVVMTGCKAGSGDVYDIVTGKLCTNNTKVMNQVSVKKIPVVATINKVEKKETSITYNPKETTESILAQVIENNKIIDYDNNSLSGREKIKGSLLATVGKIGSIMTGPMSFWVFLLIVVILLGGGYGIYNILTKKEDDAVEVKPLEKVTTATTPVTVTNVAPAVTPTIEKVEVKTNTINQSTQTNSNVGVPNNHNQTVK